jgi:hypothetical protein
VGDVVTIVGASDVGANVTGANVRGAVVVGANDTGACERGAGVTVGSPETDATRHCPLTAFRDGSTDVAPAPDVLR